MAKKLKLVCWSCGESLEDEPMPLSRFAKCRGCGVDLRTCFMCTKYSVDHPGQCREEDSDYVQYKDQANFCSFFRANPLAFNQDRGEETDSALGDLHALFGDSTSEPDTQKRATRREEAADALSELEKLFGGGQDSSDKNN